MTTTNDTTRPPHEGDTAKVKRVAPIGWTVYRTTRSGFTFADSTWSTERAAKLHANRFAKAITPAEVNS